MNGSHRPSCAFRHLPHAYTYARYYVVGWRCARHTPAALKGMPEPPPGPGWPIHRKPPPDPAAPGVAGDTEHPSPGEDLAS